MSELPKKIVIVGAGPAGARLAFLLAERKKEVILLDGKAPWEKPCGGGLTAKSVWAAPELKLARLNPREHKRVAFVFPSGRRVRISLSTPMIVVSRAALGREMLRLARDAGVEFKCEAALEVKRENNVSVVRTEAGEYEADVVVGADGVNSLVRRGFAEGFAREEICLAYAAIIPEAISSPLVIKFFGHAPGYAWIFPRRGETAVGIAMANPETGVETLKETLQEFVAEEYARSGRPAPPPLAGKSWYLPSLRPPAIDQPTLGGEGWALVGDASGACDPLTGEGIYYAFVTAESLARSLSGELSGWLDSYQLSWRNMAKGSLLKASFYRGRFYQPRNLGILGFFLDYSPGVRVLTRDLISGEQDYSSLKPRILDTWPSYAFEALVSLLKFKKGERSG